MDRRNFLKLAAFTIPGASTVGLSGCGGGSDDPIPGYPIDSSAITTLQNTVVPGSKPAVSIRLDDIGQYSRYGYGNWALGAPLAPETRTDIMPATYDFSVVTGKKKLLNFFAMTDIHITDKESPSQVIYLQQLVYPAPLPGKYAALGTHPWGFMTSAYSPVMLYTPQVLDAAIQTVNALHKTNPVDFGISLGDVCNSAQYNELRWYVDVMDGQVVAPSSGAHAGEKTIDYQKPFQAAGLDKSIPWYQTLGNHDHFWIGSIPFDGPRKDLRQSPVADTVIATGDVLYDAAGNINKQDYYMGVLDGSTPYGTIVGAGAVSDFKTPPKVVADPDRRVLAKSEWISEFFKTTTSPAGHGFNLVDPAQGKDFACYSFIPKSTLPLKVIVLDNTQRDDDGSSDIHGYGFLDQARWTWLKNELAAGDTAGQLMIIASHIPIGVSLAGTHMEWWPDPQNAVTLQGLLAELQSHPNLLMWIAGHRHVNTVKAFVSPDPVNAPEKGFWQVETSSLRDFPQQLRMFEIQLNSDYTVSIVTTNVDPAVQAGTPAATSRKYAVAAQQLFNNAPIFQNPAQGYGLLVNIVDQTAVKGADGKPVADPTIRSMPTGSYNAVLLKKLSSGMEQKLRTLFPVI